MIEMSGEIIGGGIPRTEMITVPQTCHIKEISQLVSVKRLVLD